MPSKEERGFLAAIKEAPDDPARHLVYADWLEDQGRPHDAMKQRVKAGVSVAQYKLRRKSDGLFSDGEMPAEWSNKGKAFRELGHLKAHLHQQSHRDHYGGETPWNDLEIVLFELRVQLIGTMPFALEQRPGHSWKKQVVVGDLKEA